MGIRSFALAALVVAGAGVAQAGAPAMREAPLQPAAPRMHRPPMPTCTGPAAWGAIVKCLATSQPTWKTLPRGTAHARIVADTASEPGRMYVERGDGNWQMISAYEDGTTIVGETTMMIGKIPGLRIELRRVEPFGERGVMRTKSAIVCGAPADEGSCSVLQYDCSAIENGRTVGVFKGAIVNHDGALEVVGDLRYAASCAP